MDGAPAGAAGPGSTPAQPDATPREALTAAYVAARGFLWAEWFGACVLLLSFTQLYVAVGAGLYLGAVAVGLGLFLAAVGGFVFLRSRRYYLSLRVPYRTRSHNVAAIAAGAGALFWLLFLFLAALTWFGYPVLPE